jgi:hypothetical protein
MNDVSLALSKMSPSKSAEPDDGFLHVSTKNTRPQWELRYIRLS